MQNALKAEIKKLSKRAFARTAKALKTEENYRTKYQRRTGIPATPPKPKASTKKHRHFDPKYCARNANFLAKSIWHKVLTEDYKPLPAIKYEIPKADGSKRGIMAFSIPDAALANVVLRRTMTRNLKRLSPSSYAYHPNKNVFDAVLALREFEHDGKLFAVQIDFEKYFDLIPTEYLKDKIGSKASISLTPQEKKIFESFLNHQFALFPDYIAGKFQYRHRGTPQGSSVSLLLANLANHDLDTALSAEAGKFVRFADDVIALCNDYEQAQKLSQCFWDHCNNSGLKINQSKSPGIAIISEKQEELRTHSHFDYLGYRFTPSGLTVPEKVAARIKVRISRLINLYLIQYLKDGFNSSRSSISPTPYDWDLLGLIYEIRRSLYGGLSEKNLHAFIHKGKRLSHMKGLMGFYCLLDSSQELKKLDGWMLSTIRRAMVERNKILVASHSATCPCPSNAELATGAWLDLDAWDGDNKPEPRMPSMVRGWRAARKYYYTFGLEQVEPPEYGYYTEGGSPFEY